MKLTDAVLSLRAHLRESQQAFATRLGLSIRAIANYEAGRNPTGRALVALAQAASAAGRQKLADVFLAALAKEFGLDKNLGVMHSTWNEDRTKLEGFLFLLIDGPEQQTFAHDFYTAFMVATRPESFHRPPKPEMVERARAALKGLGEVFAEQKEGTRK